MPTICTSTTFCKVEVDYSTKCANDHHCICEDSFRLDILTQKCIPVKQPRGAYCAYDLQCGAGAVCGTPSQACICKFGYLPSNTDSYNCLQHTCQTGSASDCSNTFNSPHSICSYGNLCTCNSTSGWYLNKGTQSCLPSSRPLNGSCLYDSDCGVGAVCGAGNNKCMCQLGYLPDLVGGVNCQSYSCSSDFDCNFRFKVPHVTCQLGQCQCDSANGWNLLPANQTCKVKIV